MDDEPRWGGVLSVQVKWPHDRMRYAGGLTITIEECAPRDGRFCVRVQSPNAGGIIFIEIYPSHDEARAMFENPMLDLLE